MLFGIALVGVSLTVFAIMRVLPGDVIDAIVGESSVTEEQKKEMAETLGLNRPLVVQYTDWIWGLLRFDFGPSLETREPIRDEIQRRLPVTLELAALAIMVSTVAGLSSGVVSALRQDTWVDYAVRVASLVGLAVPLFWIQSLVRNLVLPKYFGWLPPIGYVDLWDDPLTNLQQMWLPALTLGLAISALTARLTRSAMLDVLREDYVRTARAKGLTPRVVILRHTLRNALLPVLTLIGVQFGALLGGTVITETVFGLPGIGSYIVQGIRTRDYSVVQGVVVVTATLYLTINLVVEVMSAKLDPRTIAR
jgi:peptide/nickel transport system permease protein